MAEFALGLTKTAVAGTVSKVKSAIEEETKLRVRVQEDLVFITGEFEMMQSFLNVANAERANNQVVQTWVRQLRDLAFDVEDCVEFVIHLDKASRWDWVRRLTSSLICMARPPLPLDEAVEEIKRLKARVEDVSQRNTRYNLIGTSGNDDGSSNQQLQPFMRTSCTSATMATFHDLREVWKAMGKLCDRPCDLKRLIDCQGSELKVISLWESTQADVVAELGWASIMKKAYYDPETCQEFKNRAWVKLSTHHPFNPVEFLNNLLTHFTSNHHHHHDNMSKLALEVSQHRYLIVLEQELSSVAEWNAIRMCLPDGENGSRIVVFTKHLGIALLCAGNPYQVSELKCFSHDRYLYAIFPKGCGHHIGFDEFICQIRRQNGVIISLFWEDIDVKRQFMNIFYDDTCTRLREAKPPPSRLSDLARNAWTLLIESYPEQEENEAYDELWEMDDEDIFERCRQQCVATHCVDHIEYRALNLTDQIKDFDQQDHSVHTDGGGDIEEEDKFELGMLVGREDDMSLLLLRISVHSCVSVWGIPGVGKSAIVREMYNNCRHEYKRYGWVDVPHPFNLTDLSRRLLMDLYSDDVDAKETSLIGMMEGQDPVRECCKILRAKRCFIVIDGLRSTHDWDLIKATLLSHPSGKTIVITREESIATHCTSIQETETLNIKCLEVDMALDLFEKKTLDGKLPSQHYTEAEAALRITMSKCGGLPELIVSIAESICLLVQGSEFSEVLEFLNADFMKNLGINPSPKTRGLLCWMQSYFDACSDELKPCIFYMSVFPTDQSIRRRRLLRRWIAEGYSSGGDGTMEEKGEKLLSELTKLSILYQEQQTSSTYKVNGFFLEYIKSRPMEDNLVFALDGTCSPSPRLTGQHLTISSSWDRDDIVFKSMDLSRVRSLTVFGEWRSFLICDKMKMLRVLDLEGTSTSDSTSVTDDDLEKIGKQFPRLKFMSLRGCVHITRLPDSLCAMRQLETLDARHTSIVELPPGIIAKLHKLQYIRAGTTETRRLVLLPGAAAPAGTPSPPEPQEDGHHSTSPTVRAEAAASWVVQGASSGAWKKRAGGLEESCSNWWLSKNQLNLRRRRRVDANGGGVEVVPTASEGIGKLTQLHTLGVVNVACGKGGFLLLKELKKLTQLRKLGLSGVNRKNWHDLCFVISGHRHLQSLSLQLLLLEEDGNYDFASFDDISVPPKTLKRLKVLYTTGAGAGAGGACISLVWIKQLPNLRKFDHNLTISSQEDIDILYSDYYGSMGRHLRVKPIQQQLSFDKQDQVSYRFHVGTLRIDCRSISCKVEFGGSRDMYTEALNIHCCSSCGGSSCLQIVGLQHIGELKEVLVTGPCSDGFKEELRKQLDEHPLKPQLKLLTCRSH
ncbi:Disease resistance protein RPM1 [Triticum urartu]|uniref:Disease resistance protein RPM1 n=1 Tax=Triticum urartu TaxID=4572 RepID=M7ZD57_TRIUA|nr:Disease resistance protein RPM1 [Triticum urartu]